jgi:hypothetical protein
MENAEVRAAWNDVYRVLEERTGKWPSEDVRNGIVTLTEPFWNTEPHLTSVERVRRIEEAMKKSMPYSRLASEGAGMLEVPSMLESAVAVMGDLRRQLTQAERQGRIDRAIGIAGFVIGVAGLAVTLL